MELCAELVLWKGFLSHLCENLALNSTRITVGGFGISDSIDMLYFFLLTSKCPQDLFWLCIIYIYSVFGRILLHTNCVNPPNPVLVFYLNMCSPLINPLYGTVITCNGWKMQIISVYPFGSRANPAPLSIRRPICCPVISVSCQSHLVPKLSHCTVTFVSG